MGRLPELPVIAAVRDPNGAGYLTSEVWQLCVSEKQVLERTDEDVLWVTDEDSLFDELHHRTGGSDVHTFVEKDQYETFVYVKTIPKWLGPLDVKLFSKFLEKYPDVHLPVKQTNHEDYRGPGARPGVKNWKVARQFVGKLKRLPLWENYETSENGGCILLRYTPGSGERRRKFEAEQAAYARQDKKRRQAVRKSKNRYTTGIPLKKLNKLLSVLYSHLRHQLPRNWKKVAAVLPTKASNSKSRIINYILLYGGLLRSFESPHQIGRAHV